MAAADRCAFGCQQSCAVLSATSVHQDSCATCSLAIEPRIAPNLSLSSAVQVGLLPEEGDIVWTARTTLTYPALCSIAGIIAGMFGVGGGIVKGPLMLALGVLPDVAAATSATMILFTSGV